MFHIILCTLIERPSMFMGPALAIRPFVNMYKVFDNDAMVSKE